MGDSWDILHRWEPFSRDSDPDEPSPLSETTVRQLKACVAQGLSHNLAHFCSSSIPQGGLSLHWLSRCHLCPPPHTHALWLGQTPPPLTWVSLCMRLPPPHHNLQFCCQLVEENPITLFSSPATTSFFPRVCLRNLSREAALGGWFQPCLGVWSRLLAVTGAHLCGPALWLRWCPAVMMMMMMMIWEFSSPKPL